MELEKRTSEEVVEVTRAILVRRGRTIPEMIQITMRFADDLGADSLDIAEIIVEFEIRWQKELAAVDGLRIVTIGDLVCFLEGKRSEGSREFI